MTGGPGVPRWTHVALPAGDLDGSVAFYVEFAPLVVVERFENPDGRSAWLAHDRQRENPFVLVLVEFFAIAVRVDCVVGGVVESFA